MAPLMDPRKVAQHRPHPTPRIRGLPAAVFVQTLLSPKSPPSTSHSALHLVKERHHMGVHHLLGKPNELPATLFTPVIATD